MKRCAAPVLFVLTLAFLYTWHPTGGQGQGAAPCVAGDSNGDGQLNISDPIYTLQHLFSDGLAPVPCLAQGATSAFQVSFEPDGSDLSALNVQAAIEELDRKVHELTTSSVNLSVRVAAIEGEVEIDLVDIPPGTFVMGSPETESPRFPEETQHVVHITKAFRMGVTEVTQTQFKAVMGWNPSFFSACPDCPVEHVNWFDAMEFCRLLSARHQLEGKIPEGAFYRLPTESEWEYACRAGTTTKFSFGEASQCSEDTFCVVAHDHLWWIGNNTPARYGPKPVGSRQPNPWGLHDMHGNVMEWCLDWYGPYPPAEATDPTGPAEGVQKVLRGGGWGMNLGFARSAMRLMRVGPQERALGGGDFYAGFRLVLELP
jgi:formylglycine-generating enzyme required for sulfatase activity